MGNEFYYGASFKKYKIKRSYLIYLNRLCWKKFGFFIYLYRYKIIFITFWYNYLTDLFNLKYVFVKY